MRIRAYVVIAVLAVLTSGAAVTGNEDNTMWLTYYYDAEGNVVGSCDSGCNRYTCWGEQTEYSRTYNMGPCSPTWEDTSGCYIDGVYYDNCPRLPDGTKCPADQTAEDRCCPYGREWDSAAQMYRCK